jgi:hypothetical protein
LFLPFAPFAFATLGFFAPRGSSLSAAFVFVAIAAFGPCEKGWEWSCGCGEATTTTTRVKAASQAKARGSQSNKSKSEITKKNLQFGLLKIGCLVAMPM